MALPFDVDFFAAVGLAGCFFAAGFLAAGVAAVLDAFFDAAVFVAGVFFVAFFALDVLAVFDEAAFLLAAVFFVLVFVADAAFLAPERFVDPFAPDDFDAAMLRSFRLV